MPDFADYHGVSDSELTRLEAAQSSILGNLGFAALGGVIGTAPGAFVAVNTVDQGQPLKGIDLFNITLFVGSLIAAIICLAVHRTQTKDAATLADEIRGRQRRQMPS